MDHPTHEELIAYLYKEADGQARARLKRHLAACPECRATVEGWRGTMAELDAWKLRPVGRLRVARLLPLAAAAVVVLAVGFGLGRAQRPAPLDVEALRAELEISLRATLEPTIRQNLREELGAEMDELLAQALVAISDATGRALTRFAEELEATRAEERQSLLATLREMERRRLAQRALFQQDLATLVALTEDEFLRTRQDFATALAWHRPVGAVEELSMDVEDQHEGRSP